MFGLRVTVNQDTAVVAAAADAGCAAAGRMTMRISLPFLLCLAACADADPGTIPVRVVDGAGQPVPRATVWSLPRAGWERLNWVPAEAWACTGNPHELLRRLGSRHEVDESGVVRVPPDSILAGQLDALAGVTTVTDAGAAAVLVLDDRQWTIRVRDQMGQAVAGVPVSFLPVQESMLDWFEGVPLGLTDDEGQLVVRAPGSVPVARFMLRTMGEPEPPPPTAVAFEVDGMYLAAHAARLDLTAGGSGTVHLVLPPVTKVEVRLPDWHGPIGARITLTRTGKGMNPDEALCWVESGRHYGLVGTRPPRSTTPVLARVDGSSLTARADVPCLPAGETFPIAMDLPRDDIVVRCRVLDAGGQPASHCLLRVTPASAQLRTWFVLADRDGRVALVLAPTMTAAALRLEVDAARDPRWLEAQAELRVEGLHPGDRRDAGIITLDPPR